MIRALVDFALNNRFVVLTLAVSADLHGEWCRFTTCRSRPIRISLTIT